MFIQELIQPTVQILLPGRRAEESIRAKDRTLSQQNTIQYGASKIVISPTFSHSQIYE